MEFFLFFFFIIVGGSYAKYLVLNLTNFIEYRKYSEFLLFILLPFSSLWLTVRKKIDTRVFLSEALGAISFLTLLFVYSVLTKDLDQSDKYGVYFYFSYTLVSTLILLYLAISDMAFFEIPGKQTYQFILFSLSMNVLWVLISILFDREFEFITLGSYTNFLGAIFLGAFTYLLRKITNDKGLGDGDIFLFVGIGSLLGLRLSVSFLFLTLILGGLISLVYTAIRRKFKGVIIPFVPIILLGFILTLGVGESFLNTFFMGL